MFSFVFIQGEPLKRAEIAAFLKKDDEVEKIYIDMDRKYVENASIDNRHRLSAMHDSFINEQ
jgi:hypothetical protein